MKNPKSVISLLIATVALAGTAFVAPAQDKKPLPYVNEKGEISMPADFREKMAYLGHKGSTT